MIDFIAGNHHLLEKIFTFCKTSSLLQCRLVCRLWAEEATRILRKRDIAIAFKTNEDIDEFLGVDRPISQIFTSFLLDIPSADSSLLDNGQEIPLQIVDLLESYKHELKELKFWYRPQLQFTTGDGSPAPPELGQESMPPITPSAEKNCGTVEEDRGIIAMTHLESLQLLSNYVQPTNLEQRQQQNPHRMPNYFKRLVTPRLRSLAIQHLYDTDCSKVVINIIRSSCYDLEYFKIPAKLFPVVASNTGPISLENLRELDLLGIFHGFSCATNETLDRIMRSCPNLQKLGIEFSFRVILDKIQQLLHTLARTLVELRCTIQDRNLLARQILRVDFTFPEMSRLRSLQMRWSNPGLVYYIDRLPHLEELMLDTVWTRKVHGSVYPGGQPFQGPDYKRLSSLKLTQIVTAEQVEMFSKFFPSLRQLGCSFDSNEALRIVYEKMTGLKWLIIERKSNVKEAGGVCGLEEEEFLRVIENKWSKTTGTKRQMPYIGNLENLETLELCQLGISWCSILFGVAELTNLKTLVIQSKALRVSDHLQGFTISEEEYELVELGGICVKRSTPSLADITLNLKHVRNLTLWIRHTSERPSLEEITLIEQQMPDLYELNVVNHSLCGI